MTRNRNRSAARQRMIDIYGPDPTAWPIRKAKGVTFAQFADLSGISERTVRKLARAGLFDDALHRDRSLNLDKATSILAVHRHRISDIIREDVASRKAERRAEGVAGPSNPPPQ